MARKYDRYGNNRQFKTNPASRRNPFPRDDLPFQDAQSRGARASKLVSAPPPKRIRPSSSRPARSTPKVSGHTRADVERAWQMRRDATRFMRQTHPNGGLNDGGATMWSKGERQALYGGIAAPFVAATGMWYAMDPELWAGSSIISSVKNDIKFFTKLAAKAEGAYFTGKHAIRAFKNRDAKAISRLAQRHL